ncbi:hypothetical protein JRO89_XS07G0222900 [Xanthoceras sorbifolium]|uniref:Eukaryotic translation initiation factor 5B n=1 Tax=Xanthoceras sorbifolium TaxID=99658 RepID=A0ABQ8HUL3_9ROSI|nr:hypothetical protein JRO89_XS07G0222900 [Xanthoceras sorbifolium]
MAGKQPTVRGDENRSALQGNDEDDVGEIAITGKNKSEAKKSGCNGVFAASDLGLLVEEDKDDDSTVTEHKDSEEEKEESAAAKKKKKKKAKEKNKRAAAAAAVAVEEKQDMKTEVAEPKKNDGKSKGPEKKLSKQVREMQEALARRKEAEERKKKEEEERIRKEEEEQKRQEELEKQAEEARRRKKEKEKEKLLKKKQEGKLLTGKQKEEARRLEAMRNQILTNAAIPLLSVGDKEGAPTKRPKYQTKKSKPGQHQVNDAAASKMEENMEAKAKDHDPKETVAHLASMETKKVEVGESLNVIEKSEFDGSPLDNGMKEGDVDDEWDAKSWDDINLNVRGAFDDEIDSKPTVDVADKSGKNDAAAECKAPCATPKQAEEILRSPICCIMGHVDAGKTKLLDFVRGTNVQEGEAGFITQQIGATYFPAENIRERTKELKADAKLKVPGLLVIDTSSHESFTNLRSRGSGLCDIAILVVDIMEGLKPQTIESLNLLKMRNTKFIVVLNKVDRLYGWKMCRNAPIVKALKQQSKDVQNQFNMKLIQIITQFKEQGFNTELYYKNKEMGEIFSIVPTSAVSGEGIPDLLLLLVQWTQKTMVEKLTFSNEVQVCFVLLSCLGTYLHHKEIKAAQGIKITAQGLEHAIAGTGLYVVGPDDDVEDVKEAAMEDMKSVMNRIDKTGEGVYVQASTLGSLEALLEFLKSPDVKIPVSGIGIGPVHKKDVMKASVMLEKKKEFATILAFDVKVTPEAHELSKELGVKIFIDDVIYHLFDQFKIYICNLKEEKKREAADEAVFPCVLEILRVLHNKNPIILGVDVLEGIARVGSPICILQKNFIDIGRIASIENNRKPVEIAKKGQEVSVKSALAFDVTCAFVFVQIVGSNPEEQQKIFGRHFDLKDKLVSHISRRSIDVLEAHYWDDLSPDERKLVVKLKNIFKIQ